MPRAIKMAEGHFVLAIRERRSSHQWISIWETRDNWKTVNQLSRIAFDADNPPAFVKVGTDLFVIYCSRVSGPTGLVFVRSSDGGVSWSLPVYLRTDAYSWDVGYPVAFVREDGKILTCYYYHTADNQYQYIASTVFDPAAVGDLPLMPEYAPMYPETETI